MANFISLADGNFTDAATWAAVDSTALNTASTTGTALTTSYVACTAFAPGAITVDGVALKINVRNAGSPVTTMSVLLRNTTDATDLKTVVVNLSDIPVCSAADQAGGWHFFKFDAPILLHAVDSHTISVKLSATTVPCSIQQNGTAGNWLHMLRIPGTTHAPAATDDLHVMREFNAPDNAGTVVSSITNRTITMDNTATTDFGAGANANDNLGALTIGTGCTVNYGTSAATNYYLKLSGNLLVHSGGTFTMGTTGTPIPRDSSAILDFDCESSKLYGLKLFGTAIFTAQGQSRTSGKNVYFTYATSNLAVGATTVNVADDTGWLVGDSVAFAPTTRTQTEHETRTLTGSDAGASSFTVAALTYAHSGTTPTRAEIIHLTRNVKVRSLSTTYYSILYCSSVATMNCDWVEFKEVGMNLALDTTSSVDFAYCSLVMNSNSPCMAVAGANANNFFIRYFVAYNPGNVSYAAVDIPATTGTNWRVSDSVVIAGPYGFNFLDTQGIIDNLSVSGTGSNGLVYQDTTSYTPFTTSPTFTVHSCAGWGFYTNTPISNVQLNLTVWRCGHPSYGGIQCYAGGTAAFWYNVTLNLNCFGNGVANVILGYNPFLGCRMIGDVSSDTTFTTPAGIKSSAVAVGATGLPCQWTFDNMTFGVATGIRAAHTTADIDLASSYGMVQWKFRNCAFGSGTELSGSAYLHPLSYLSYSRYQQTSGGSHKYVTPRGAVSCEPAVFHSAAPSEKLTPVSASVKLESSEKLVALNTSQGCTVTVWVRKSAAYNGNAPRLVLKYDPAVSAASADAVIDTFTAAADTWEQLSGVVPALIDNAAATLLVDCDGTAGYVYVDDWAVS